MDLNERNVILSARLKKEYEFGNQLASAVGCWNTTGSIGDKWLLSVRNAMMEAVDNGDLLSADYPADMASEIAGDLAPDNDWDRFKIFTDLELWKFDSDFANFGKKESTYGPIVPIEYEDLSDVIGSVVWEIASNLCSILTGEVLQWAEELGNDTDDDEE